MTNIFKRLGLICVAFAFVFATFSIISFGKANAEVTYEAQIGETRYETLESAVDFVNASDANDLTIELLSDITLGDIDGAGLHIRKGVVINGNGKKITLSTHKGIRLYGGQTEQDKVTFVFNNLTVYNPSTKIESRGLETRGGYMSVTLNGVTIKTDAINSQPITIGGNHDGGYANDFTINGGEIYCGNQSGYGYGVITFNPVNLTVTGTKFTTWSAFYAKTPNSSYGARGTVALFKDCEIKAINPSLEPSNSFSTFVIQDDEVSLTIDGCKINLVYPEGQYQSVVAFDKVTDRYGNLVSEAKDGKITITGNTEIKGAIEGGIIIDESENKENAGEIISVKVDAPIPQQYISTDSTINSAGAVVTVNQLRADAIVALNESKQLFLNLNGYTSENKASMNAEFALAVNAINGASNASGVEQALADFASSVGEIEFIPFDTFKLKVEKAIADYRDEVLKNNSYTEENAEKIKADAKKAISKVDSATTCVEMESIFASFKASANKVDKIDTALIWAIILICLGAIALGVGAFFLVKVIKERAEQKAEEAVETEEVDETANESQTDDETVVTVDESETAEVETAPEESSVVEEVEKPRSQTTDEEFSALPKAKTFEEKLDAGDEKTKDAYAQITEKLNGYKKVKSRRSKRAETYKVGRAHIVKLQFSGKSVRCYLALNPSDYDEKTYKHKDMSSKRSMVKTPFMMKLRSKKAIKNTLALIDELAISLDLKPKKK